VCCLESTAVAGAGEEVELDGVMVHGAELMRDEVRGYARGYQLVRGSLEMTGPGVVVKKTRMSAPNHDPTPARCRMRSGCWVSSRLSRRHWGCPNEEDYRCSWSRPVTRSSRVSPRRLRRPSFCSLWCR
jgi:hypothetical protein